VLKSPVDSINRSLACAFISVCSCLFLRNLESVPSLICRIRIKHERGIFHSEGSERHVHRRNLRRAAAAADVDRYSIPLEKPLRGYSVLSVTIDATASLSHTFHRCRMRSQCVIVDRYHSWIEPLSIDQLPTVSHNERVFSFVLILSTRDSCAMAHRLHFIPPLQRGLQLEEVAARATVSFCGREFPFGRRLDTGNVSSINIACHLRQRFKA